MEGSGNAAVMPVGSIGDDPVDTIAIGLVPVKTKVILYDQIDDEGGADADRKAQHVNERDDLVPPETAKGCFKVGYKHSRLSYLFPNAV